MKSSVTRPKPSSRRPRYLCQCCEEPLQLDGVRRAWPKPPSPADRKHRPGRDLTVEVVCRNCRYVNFLSLPTSTGHLFGMPDELAAMLLAGIEIAPDEGETFAQTSAYRARFWSLAERIAAMPCNKKGKKGAGHE